MKSCCFIGHRNVQETAELYEKIKQTLLRLIQEEDVVFLFFGSKSSFDSLCLKVATEIKSIYPHIQRVYVRSCYQTIESWYRKSLLKEYDDTIIPDGVADAKQASYVKRNRAMIDASDFCVFYYDEDYQPPIKKPYKRSFYTYRPNSGTKVAYEYATKKKKQTINLCELAM